MLGVLGHIGITAYVGVLEVAKPQPGETFLVSAAASGVGSIAGQIAKMQGARVHRASPDRPRSARGSSTSSASTRASTTRPKTSPTGSRSWRPQGVDIFFDNVGGRLLDTVLRRIAMHARVVLCGDISTYNSDTPTRPLHNIRYLMGKRARMEGFNTLDHWDHYHEAAAQLAEWKAAGTLKFREHVLDGLDRAPEALVRLFVGRPPRQARRQGARAGDFER